MKKAVVGIIGACILVMNVAQGFEGNSLTCTNKRLQRSLSELKSTSELFHKKSQVEQEHAKQLAPHCSAAKRWAIASSTLEVTGGAAAIAAGGALLMNALMAVEALSQGISATWVVSDFLSAVAGAEGALPAMDFFASIMATSAGSVMVGAAAAPFVSGNVNSELSGDRNPKFSSEYSADKMTKKFRETFEVLIQVGLKPDAAADVIVAQGLNIYRENSYRVIDNVKANLELRKKDRWKLTQAFRDLTYWTVHEEIQQDILEATLLSENFKAMADYADQMIPKISELCVVLSNK